MVRSQNEFLALLQKMFKHGCIVKISNSGSAILEVKKYPKAPIWKARTANSVKRKKSVPTPAYFINFFLVSVLRWCSKYQVSAGSLFIRQLHRNDEIKRETLSIFVALQIFIANSPTVLSYLVWIFVCQNLLLNIKNFCLLNQTGFSWLAVWCICF